MLVDFFGHEQAERIRKKILEKNFSQRVKLSTFLEKNKIQ